MLHREMYAYGRALTTPNLMDIRTGTTRRSFARKSTCRRTVRKWVPTTTTSMATTDTSMDTINNGLIRVLSIRALVLCSVRKTLISAASCDRSLYINNCVGGTTLVRFLIGFGYAPLYINMQPDLNWIRPFLYSWIKNQLGFDSVWIKFLCNKIGLV